MNEYASQHFNNTLAALRRRNLDLLVTLPYFQVRKEYPDSTWEDYDEVWAKRQAQ